MTRIHVVAGILGDARGRVLLAQRPSGKHAAGLWEFPGGKIEPGETPNEALRRELREELGVEIGAIEALIRVPWDFPSKSIDLDVYRVHDFVGEPHGREGQALRWQSIDALTDLPMPPPDRPVITALRLPEQYAITPEPAARAANFLKQIDCVLAGGVRLLQLRTKALPALDLRELAMATATRARAAGATLLINSHWELARDLSLDGVHLASSDLMRLRQRPLPTPYWVAASCHNADELQHAADIGVDFAVLGPVLPTRSHADAESIGWPRFAELAAQAPMPVYALGGLGRGDVRDARTHGAQGIAGISAFFDIR